MNEFMTALRKYAVFQGRARRREYWMFTLGTVILGVIAGAIDAGLTAVAGVAFVGILLNLALIVPSLSVTARRLHDIGRSGWWMLLILIPLVGWIVLFIFSIKGGDQGPNAWGDDPKDD